MTLLMLETIKFVCGFWKDGSLMIMVDVNTERWMSFRKIKMRMLK